MSGRRLIFDVSSESEEDSHHGSSSERGDNPGVSLAGFSELATASMVRESEASEPLEFGDEPVMATINPVVMSRPGGGFLKENPSSAFKEFDMLKLRYMYQIPASVEIRAPLPHERVDWDVPGWWSFYEFAFEAGFRFPVPKLVRDCLSHFGVAPSQLMPNAWRILMSLECISMRTGIEYGLSELLYTYFLREHDREKGRYNLYVRPDRDQLVCCLRTNDRKWKRSYFFARGDLVFGPSGHGDVPSFWMATGEYFYL